MNDLIRRQDVIDAIEDEISKESHRPHQITLLHAKRRMERLPSAEPEQRVGKWIIGGHHIRCSACDVYMCSTDREGDKIPTTFCPNCGARMEEQNEVHN